MAITTAFCTSAKVDLFFGRHNFSAVGGHTFKLALYTSSATLGASTTAYTASGEAAVLNGTGYSAGGVALTNVDPTSSSTTAFVDFANVAFTLNEVSPSVSLAASGCLIYNDSITTPVADAAIAAFSFGATPQAIGDGATFTVNFPTPGASTAVLRLA